MRILISPAKKMVEDSDSMAAVGKPVFMDEARKLCDKIRGLSYEEAKKMWGCNDKIAEQNYERFAHMNVDQGLTPAILAYEGIQYQYMAPKVMELKSWDYIQEHVRILSGFYGVLKPLDGVVSYRLEMQAKLSLDGKKDLYDFWGRKLYDQLSAETDWIVNLASREYSKAVEKWLEPKMRYTTCFFLEEHNGKLIQKGTMAKMARGEMVRYLAENEGNTLEAIQSFTGLNYRYAPEKSSENEIVFIKEAK